MPAPKPTPVSRRDSWPPTQVRLQNSVEKDDTSIEEVDMDDDPLTYFLTPAPLLQDEDDYGDPAMMDFDFDAGIEDNNHRPEIVRSVSPSSLDGLSLPPPRPPTPPRRPPSRLSPDPESTTDEDEDGEDYIRFGAGRLHGIDIPFSLRDFAAMKAKRAARSKAAAEALLAPASAHSPGAASRGRPAVRFGSSPPGSRLGPAARGLPPARRRSPHVWRVPSPDVWSIEEETEEELNSDIGSSVCHEDLAARSKEEDTKMAGTGLEAKAAKPKKRVRFVLPAEAA